MRYLAALLLVLVFCSPAFAATKFPALTGRVVDNAHILSEQTQAALSGLLRAHEQKTGEQIVVATVPSLDGNDIAPYANQLFRNWQLGQKGKNNGILLLVAPTEHLTRIEVGYGLEDKITDAISSQIIQTIMLPEFKAGQMEKGVSDGTVALLTILEGGEIAPAAPVANGNNGNLPPWVIIVGIIFIIIIRWRFGIWIIPFGAMGRSSGRDDDSFSGSGGSSGGGGSSGKW